jgi:hypothetical protein
MVAIPARVGLLESRAERLALVAAALLTFALVNK